MKDAMLWEQAEWLDSAVGWIEKRLAELGLETAGRIEQRHVRPWSTVMYVPTTDGDV